MKRRGRLPREPEIIINMLSMVLSPKPCSTLTFLIRKADYCKAKNLAHYHTVKGTKAEEYYFKNIQKSTILWPTLHPGAIFPKLRDHVNKWPTETTLENVCQYGLDAISLALGGGSLRMFGEGLYDCHPDPQSSKDVIDEWDRDMGILFAEMERLQKCCVHLSETGDNMACELVRDISLATSIVQELIVASDLGQKHFKIMHKNNSFTFQCI